MLKIKDNTSKQDFSVQNTGFWDNDLILSILLEMKSIRNGIIYINDITVKLYNERKGHFYLKSNASFVRQVRKMNRENKFDDLEKVEE